MLLAPFVPMLFQGEEWGASTPFQYFTDHDDPELGRAVSEGRRARVRRLRLGARRRARPAGPDTFERSKLRWDEPVAEPHASVLAWHRALIDLAGGCPTLTDGRLDAVDVASTRPRAGWS